MVINKALMKMKKSLSRSTSNASTNSRSQSEAASKSSSGSAASSAAEADLHLERNIETPGERDILLGRGRTSWSHSGNQQFRTFVGMYLKKYTESKSRADKTKTVHLIYEEIIEAGGRFLKLDTGTGTWYQVGRSVAREKIAHTLRDAIGLRIKLTVPDDDALGGASGADAANILLGGGGSRAAAQRKKTSTRKLGSTSSLTASKSKSGGAGIFAHKQQQQIQQQRQQEQAKPKLTSPFPLFSPATVSATRTAASASDHQAHSRLFVSNEPRPDDSVSAEEVLSCSTATLSNVSLHNSSQAGASKSNQLESGESGSGSGSDPQRSASVKRKKSCEKGNTRVFNLGDSRPSQRSDHSSVRSADKKSFNDLVNSMITELDEDRHTNKDGTSSTVPSTTPSAKVNAAALINKQRQEQRAHEQRVHDQRVHEQRVHEERVHEQRLQEQIRLRQEQEGQPGHNNGNRHDFDRESATMITLADDDISAGFSAMSLETSKSGRSFKSMGRSKGDSKHSNEGSKNSAMFELSEEFRTARSHNTTPSPTAGMIGNVGIPAMHDQDLLLRHRGKVANCAQPLMFDNGGPVHHNQHGYNSHDDDNCGASFGGGSMDWAKGVDVVSDMGSLDDFSLASKETTGYASLTKNSRVQPAPIREKHESSQDSRRQESSMDSSEKSSETEREWRKTLQALRSS